ncbi:MAG: hypothetical protein JW913_04940 [Chitinispirillaceae bacterium]|nr:hypothetical protein [Chitinispirillaceae bacterium]
MELILKSKRLLLGGLTGSFITLFGPVTPIGLNGEYFTLEELSWQTARQAESNDDATRAFVWVNSKGFVLQRKHGNGSPQTAPLRRAVYRRVIDKQ